MSLGVLFTGYPVIGYQNKMQASGSCLNDQNNIVDGYCGWDPRIKGQFSSSNGFTLPMNKVTSFIKDLKKLVNMDPTSFCGFDLYLGILMRYVKVSSAYLGKDEDGIDFDITYYRPREALSPQLNEDIINEIEQIAIFKYGGVPHWGKNRNVAFEGVISKYKDGEKFLRVKERYDPLGLFSSEWTDQVLGLKDGIIIDKTGCALEGLCRCNTDDDCGTGYTCGSGRVYAEAKVCKKKRSNLISDECLSG